MLQNKKYIYIVSCDLRRVAPILLIIHIYYIVYIYTLYIYTHIYTIYIYMLLFIYLFFPVTSEGLHQYCGLPQYC